MPDVKLILDNGDLVLAGMVLRMSNMLLLERQLSNCGLVSYTLQKTIFG